MYSSRSHRAGLSPLARGTLIAKVSDVPRDRFIPAGAGNTALSQALKCTPTVYPRWRGEHYDIADLVKFEHGLSPLARGTLAESGRLSGKVRFIPAGAGNTNSRPEPVNRSAVYPRWRGEHDKDGKMSKIRTGLSPLARGTPGQSRRHWRIKRFIPAGAGNT